MSEWTEYTKLLVALLAICNPIGALPVFLGLTAGMSSERRRRITTTVSIATTITLLVVSGIGTQILSFFGITLDAFRIAGGILLLIMSMGMMGVTAGSNQPGHADDAASVGVVPLAIPLMAGPGSISTVILHVGHDPTFLHRWTIAAVILTIGIMIFFILRGGLLGVRFLSPVTLTVFNRIMGLIIAALGVEFIIDGILAHFPALAAT